MRNSEKKKGMFVFHTRKHFLKLLILATVFLTCVSFSFAQPVLPQRSLNVTATQGIHFGTFSLSGSSGGSITVGYDGSRTSNGDVVLLSKAPTARPAIFEIKLCEGRNVTINFDATTILSGSSGGTMILNLGPTEKGISGASFSTNSDCNFITPLRMGGTLEVPGTSIPGTFTGSFNITFNQD